MVSSLWTNVFLWKILFIFILLQVALSFAFAANGSDAVVLQQHSRNRFFVGIDWLRRFVQVNLTSSFNIFGRGMFDKLYVSAHVIKRYDTHQALIITYMKKIWIKKGLKQLFSDTQDLLLSLLSCITYTKNIISFL